MQENFDEASNRLPGRPRSEAARQAILDAAFQLERKKGYAGVTLQEVAQTAKVGRQTIYRWWPTKGELYFELIFELIKRAAAEIDMEALDLEDYLRFLSTVTREKLGTMSLGLFMEGQSDPKLLAKLQERIVARRTPFIRVAEKFAEKRQKQYAVSVDILADMLLGTMWYRLLTGNGAVDDALAHELAMAAEALLKP